MKTPKKLGLNARLMMPLLIMFVFTAPMLSQSDTLHLIYHHTQKAAHDTTLARIDKWIKTLKGKHVDITVIGYYPQSNIKPYAQERVDELFLVLNRKARDLFTFGEFTTKKGKDYQRTMVDIIYKPSLSPQEAAAAAVKAKADAEAKKEAEKRAAAAEKTAKDNEKDAKENEKKANKTASDNKKKDDGSKPAEEKEVKSSDKDKKPAKVKDEKKDDGKEGDDDEDKAFAYSTVLTINEGDLLTLEEVNYIKAAKLIVAQTGDKGMDDNLLKAVKDCWSFTSDISSMPYKDARKMGKENKKENIVILSVAQVKTWFTQKNFGMTIRTVKIGRALCMENGSGKTLYKQIIPTAKGVGVANEYMVFGVSFMNHLFYTMSANNIEKSSKVKYMSPDDATDLKAHRLVIAESMIAPKLPVEDIARYYSGKVDLVSDQDWKDAINQKKDVAYVMIVKVPSINKACWHYIVNAKTGRVYLYDRGPNFQMGISVMTTVNLDPSQSGYVDKANFERYEKAMIGEDAAEAKKKEQEDAEKKEKAEKKAKAKEEKAKK